MPLPIDDLLKAVARYAPVDKTALKGVVSDVIPTVAKEVEQGATFVKSLPVESFATDLTDKLRRVQSGADAKALLDEHVQKNFASIPASQYMSDARVAELEESYGYSKTMLKQLTSGKGALERVTSAALDLSHKAIDDTRYWASELLKGTPGASQEMLKSFDVASEMLAQSTGLGSTLGRSFRLLQAGPQGSLEALKEAASRDTLMAAKMKTSASLEDFARIVTSTDNKSLMKMANQIQDPSWNGAIREFYYNSMLSRVKTQGKNIIGNAFNVGINIAERYINAGVSTVFGSGNVTFDDANNLVKGYWQGFREALSKWAPAYHGNVDPRWAGKGVIDEPGSSNLEQLLGTQMGKTGLFVGKHLQAPTKTLQATDTFYKEWTYYAELYAESARRAAVSGENFDDVFEKFYRNPTTELTETARHRAETQALVMTHTEDLWNKWENTGGSQAFQGIGRMADALNQAKQHSWILTVTMPFVKTSANALRFNLERFPGINMLDKRFRADMLGRNGSAARELAITKTLMGGSVMGMFALAAANGEVTGSAPRDPELRASFLAAHPEYSINFGGVWVSYDPGSTLGALLATAATTGAALGAKTGVEYESMTDALAWSASLAFAEINDTVPMMEPVGTLMDMMGNGDFPSDDKITDKMLRGLFRYANQAVPGILQDVQTLVDPVQKDLQGIQDYLTQYMPGHGEVPNLDAFGRKRMLGYGFSDSAVPNTVRFLTGFNVQPENLSVVDQELLRLGVGVKERTKVRGVDLGDPSLGNRGAELRHRMQSTAGPEAYSAVEEFVNSEMYKELNDNGRREIIKRLIYQAYDMASARLMMEDEPLRAKIMQTALEERTIRP